MASTHVGTALLLATVLSLLIYGLTSDGEPVTEDTVAETASTQLVAAGPDPTSHDADSEDAANSVQEQVAAPGPMTSEGFDAETTGAEPAQIGVAQLESQGIAGFGEDAAAVAAASLITNMGPTEVGYVTNFAAVNYTWQRVELSRPGVAEMGWLGRLNGQFVAITPGWGSAEPDSPAQTLVTQTSSDGIDWENANAYPLPDETWISRIISDGERVVAIGERWSQVDNQNEYTMFSTEDGLQWTATEFVFDSGPDEHVYIHDAVMGPAGIALSAQFETSPEGEPQVLVIEPYEIVLDHMRNSFTLAETATGDVVLSGSLDEVFDWGSDGQNIYDPATGELITTVPYEVWEQAWNEFYGPGWGGPPLPIPVDIDEPAESPQIVVEYDGFVIEVNEYAGVYVVTDAGTDEEIATGGLDDLYQGPPPTFADPETGEVLLSVSWDEWYRAEEQSYMDRGHEEPFDYRARTVLVTSPDGDTWEQEIVSDGTGSSTSFLAATDDGFVTMVNTYEEYGGERGAVWTMSDGVWSVTPATRTDLWLHQVASTNGGLIGVGDSAGGQGVWSSPDGVAWVSEFATVPQDDGSHAYLADVSADSAGTVGALAVRERWSGCGPLVIEQARYTATFEDGEVALRVTETQSGNTVVVFGWEEFDDGSAADSFTWDGEATSIDLGNGDVMVITDAEARAVTESRYAEGGQIGLSVFLNDGIEWKEAVVDVEGQMSGASQLLLVDGQIFISGT